VISGIALKGVDRLVSSIGQACDDLATMERAGDLSGRLLTSGAAAAAPRRTGRLAGSIAQQVDGPTLTVGTDLVYGPPIHSGWPAHHIEAHPFLETSLERNERRVIDIYSEEVGHIMARVEGV
jgi:hypothetical protein